MNYLLEKIKQNVYSLIIKNKDNKEIYKILKVSINFEEYLNEYNIYKELLDENKNYNIENISNYLKFENINKLDNINIKFDDDNITINIPVINLLSEDYDGILNLYILYGNYNPHNKTLNDYLMTKNSSIILTIVNNALINRRNASNTKNLKHCDYKTNNILIDNLLNVYLFDFDFSLILKPNETIILTEDHKVNLYLNLELGTKISGEFLDFFDIYLFALSIVYCYNIKNLKNLIKIQNFFENSLISNQDLCDDFYIFFIILSNIILKLPKNFNHDIYLLFASYKVIYKILKKPIVEFTPCTNSLFFDEQYLDAIEFIKKVIQI